MDRSLVPLIKNINCKISSIYSIYNICQSSIQKNTLKQTILYIELNVQLIAFGRAGLHSYIQIYTYKKKNT